MLLGVLGQIVSLYMGTTGDGADCSTPTSAATADGGTAVGAASNNSTRPAAINNGVPTANSVMMPAVPESPADVTVATPPPENTTVPSQVAADVVIGTTVLSGDTTVPGNNTMQMSENHSAVAAVSAAEPTQVELTTEQRRFIAERSVTLLVKLTKGEVTPEAALREAEKIPERKGKKSAGSR